MYCYPVQVFSHCVDGQEEGMIMSLGLYCGAPGPLAVFHTALGVPTVWVIDQTIVAVDNLE